MDEMGLCLGFNPSNLESGIWRWQGPPTALSAMWQASDRCDCMAAVKQKKKVTLFTILELLTEKNIEKVELRGKNKDKREQKGSYNWEIWEI